MKKEEKIDLVGTLHADIERASALFVTDYMGLNVEEITKLRDGIRGAGGTYQVVKNTLLKRAIQETTAHAVEDLFIGPTAIALSQGDPVALAKALVAFAKANDKLEVQGGVLGERVLSVRDIQELATLPGREVLLAKMLGSMNAPVSNFVGVFAAMLRQLVYVLKAIEEQKNQGQN